MDQETTPNVPMKWDMMQMYIAIDDIGSVGVTFQREDVIPGTDLMADDPHWSQKYYGLKVVVRECTDKAVLVDVSNDRGMTFGMQVSSIQPQIESGIDVMGEEGASLQLRLLFLPVTIREYDEIEVQWHEYTVDPCDFVNAPTDSGSAMRLADSIAEQTPEALEVIAKYMAQAADLGHPDAKAWLYDYYNGDSRWDAYI